MEILLRKEYHKDAIVLRKKQPNPQFLKDNAYNLTNRLFVIAT